MRILRIAQKTYPDVKGGGTYHVHAMSRDQAAMGHNVTVLTVNSDSKKPHLEERDDYAIIRYAPDINVLGNDIALDVAQYLTEIHKFDIIHAHSHLYFSTNLAAMKRRFGDIPLAITNHGLYSQNAPEWLFDQYLRTVGRWTFNQADVVFCYTEEDKQRVHEFGVKSNIEVVPNGIDTERFTPKGSKSELIDHDGPVVLFVGRLVEGKRPQDAIAAIGQINEEYPDVKLYLCGNGAMREELEEQVADEKLEESVRFLGQVTYNEMPALYRTGDALILPSRTEGLPRTVLEAMACNVSVVCSDLEQITPVINGAGTTVPIGDVGQLASALVKSLFTDAHQQGRPIIKKGFKWSETVQRTTAMLEACSN